VAPPTSSESLPSAANYYGFDSFEDATCNKTVKHATCKVKEYHGCKYN